MREIKFRYLLDDGWVYYALEVIESDETTGADILNREYKARNQYTGFKDKNEREIYDSDIIKTPMGIGQVLNRLGCWFVEMQQELGYFKTYDLEIIGNIYENPELLK